MSPKGSSFCQMLMGGSGNSTSSKCSAGTCNHVVSGVRHTDRDRYTISADSKFEGDLQSCFVLLHAYSDGYAIPVDSGFLSVTCNHNLFCCMQPWTDTQYLQTLNWSVTSCMHQLWAGDFVSWSCMVLSIHMCTDMPASCEMPASVLHAEPASVCRWMMRQHHNPAESHCCMPRKGARQHLVQLLCSQKGSQKGRCRYAKQCLNLCTLGKCSVDHQCFRLRLRK